MSDLINRQAAIDLADAMWWSTHDKNIHELWSKLKDLPPAQPDLSDYSDRLWKAAYERGKAEAEPRWIPCEEQLPEKSGEYLVTYHPCYWDDVESEILVGVDTFRGKTTRAKRKYQRVTAWMPLPKPYERSEE